MKIKNQKGTIITGGLVLGLALSIAVVIPMVNVYQDFNTPLSGSSKLESANSSITKQQEAWMNGDFSSNSTASPARISADIRTAEQIGKATRIWVTDWDSNQKRKVPTNPTRYDEIEGLTPDYISDSFTANSYENGTGYYYVCEEDGKIKVGIAESDLELINDFGVSISYDATGPAWAFIEQ